MTSPSKAKTSLPTFFNTATVADFAARLDTDRPSFPASDRKEIVL
jgi:hypothetical protein